MGAAILSPIPVRSVPYCSGSRASANRFRPNGHGTGATELPRSAALFALAQREEIVPDQHFAITGPLKVPFGPTRRPWSRKRVSTFALDAEAVDPAEAEAFELGAPAIGGLAFGTRTNNSFDQKYLYLQYITGTTSDPAPARISTPCQTAGGSGLRTRRLLPQSAAAAWSHPGTYASARNRSW